MWHCQPIFYTKFSSAPKQAAIQVLTYVANTFEYGLSSRGSIQLVGYSDALIGHVTLILDGNFQLFFCAKLRLSFLEDKEAKFSFYFIDQS